MNRTLFIGIFLLVGFVAGIFLTWPKYQDFQVLSAERQEKEQEQENREAYFADLAKVKSDLSQFPEELAKVEAALPKDPQLPALYDFLQSSAALSGMSTKGISAAVETQKQALLMRTIPVTLELTGSWGAVKELVSRLNTASRLSLLQSLNITGGVDPGRFNVTVQLNTYSY